MALEGVPLDGSFLVAESDSDKLGTLVNQEHNDCDDEAKRHFTAIKQ